MTTFATRLMRSSTGLISAMLICLPSAGCDGRNETTDPELRDQAAQAGEQVREAGREVGETLGIAGERVGEALEEGRERVGESLERAGRDMQRGRDDPATRPANPRP